MEQDWHFWVWEFFSHTFIHLIIKTVCDIGLYWFYLAEDKKMAVGGNSVNVLRKQRQKHSMILVSFTF